MALQSEQPQPEQGEEDFQPKKIEYRRPSRRTIPRLIMNRCVCNRSRHCKLNYRVLYPMMITMTQTQMLVKNLRLMYRLCCTSIIIQNVHLHYRFLQHQDAHLYHPSSQYRVHQHSVLPQPAVFHVRFNRSN